MIESHLCFTNKSGEIMATIELFILAVALSLDAFAISICKGMSLRKATIKHMCIAGLWCGIAQALMPIVGYFFGNTFIDVIHKFNHWIEFTILVAIGLEMVIKGFLEYENSDNISHKKMFALAVVDSFDVLAVSITFPELHINLPLAMVIIGVTTFIIAALGVKVGSLFGGKFRTRATVFGGMILIIIGTHLLLKGLGILSILPFL
jgi:putative Mn2+ efflux pump MntP